MSGALRTFAGYHAGEREELTLVAGALRADGTSPMIGAGPVYLARATLVGVSLGRMGAGEHADLMFEDVTIAVNDPRFRIDPAYPVDKKPRLRLWTTGAGRDEAARIFRAIFDEAEVDAAIAGMGEDEAGTIGLGPRRVRLLLVDVDPREFEGNEDNVSAATEIVTYAIGIGRER